MTMFEVPRICPECGKKTVIPTADAADALLICVECFNRYEDWKGVLILAGRSTPMTADRGPSNWPTPQTLGPRDLVSLYARRSDHAAEGAAQHYIDRMENLGRYYDTNHTPPMFTPPQIWMLGLEDPLPAGAPHNLLQRARLAELFDPRAAS